MSLHDHVVENGRLQHPVPVGDTQTKYSTGIFKKSIEKETAILEREHNYLQEFQNNFLQMDNLAYIFSEKGQAALKTAFQKLSNEQKQTAATLWNEFIQAVQQKIKKDKYDAELHTRGQQKEVARLKKFVGKLNQDQFVREYKKLDPSYQLEIRMFLKDREKQMMSQKKHKHWYEKVWDAVQHTVNHMTHPDPPKVDTNKSEHYFTVGGFMMDEMKSMLTNPESVGITDDDNAVQKALKMGSGVVHDTIGQIPIVNTIAADPVENALNEYANAEDATDVLLTTTKFALQAGLAESGLPLPAILGGQVGVGIAVDRTDQYYHEHKSVHEHAAKRHKPDNDLTYY